MTDATVGLEGIGHWQKFLPHCSGRAFRDKTLSIRAGETFANLGQNGCGKTTLLKIILGILAPRVGQVRLGGGIGFVPQLFVSKFSLHGVRYGADGPRRRSRHVSQSVEQGRRHCPEIS